MTDKFIYIPNKKIKELEMSPIEIFLEISQYIFLCRPKENMVCSKIFFYKVSYALIQLGVLMY